MRCERRGFWSRSPGKSRRTVEVNSSVCEHIRDLSSSAASASDTEPDLITSPLAPGNIMMAIQFSETTMTLTSLHHDGVALGRKVGSTERLEDRRAATIGGANVDEQHLILVVVDDGGQGGDHLDALARGQLAPEPVSYTHLRAHETGRNLVCRLLLE